MDNNNQKPGLLKRVYEAAIEIYSEGLSENNLSQITDLLKEIYGDPEKSSLFISPIFHFFVSSLKKSLNTTPLINLLIETLESEFYLFCILNIKIDGNNLKEKNVFQGLIGKIFEEEEEKLKKEEENK